MGALLSLPFLSFLLIPTTTSYSTSLNLLFFWLTWSTLVLSHPPLRVELMATIAVRVLFYIIPSLLFLAFDVALPGAAEKLKSMGPIGLPLKETKRGRATRVGMIVFWSLTNVCLGIAAQGGAELLLTQILGLKHGLKVTSTLPMPLAIFKDIVRGFLVRESLGYTLHRWLLHHSRSPLSAYHDSWYHSIAAPIPLSASYDHPVPYLVHNFIPTFGPALLLRFHLLTYILFLALVSLEETFVHSGYSTLPTNFLLGGIARRVLAHLVLPTDRSGNYGPWGLLDWLCGTTVATAASADDDGDSIVSDLTAEASRRLPAATNLPSVAGKTKRRKLRGRTHDGDDVDDDYDDYDNDAATSSATNTRSSRTRARPQQATTRPARLRRKPEPW